jgi:hypothetical protein
MFMPVSYVLGDMHVAYVSYHKCVTHVHERLRLTQIVNVAYKDC